MTVKDLIIQLLDCPSNAEVLIVKEVDWNKWINSKVRIASVEKDAVLLDFDFPKKLFDK